MNYKRKFEIQTIYLVLYLNASAYLSTNSLCEKRRWCGKTKRNPVGKRISGRHGFGEGSDPDVRLPSGCKVWQGIYDGNKRADQNAGKYT